MSASKEICKAFDVPVWLVVGAKRPRWFRLRWAIRRFTGYIGD